MEQVDIRSNGKIVRFLTKDGLKLNGMLFRSGPKPSKTCMIFIHGMAGSFLSNVSLALAGHIGKDYDLFAINTRGYSIVSGFSRITKKKKERLTLGTAYERFEDSVYDIEGAIRAMKIHGYRRIVLCGHSTGCQKVAYYEYKTKDRNVKALVLVAPCDDYEMNRKMLGKGYGKMLALCKDKIKKGRGNDFVGHEYGFSAQRIDSLINLKRVEARLFDYDGDLKEFSSITIPILAIFSTEEEYAMKPVDYYIDILQEKTTSRKFGGLLIEGAGHSFYEKEMELAKGIHMWLSGI